MVAWHALITLGTAFAATSKRGTSGLVGCKDASSLNLGNTWDYNWGLMPAPGGSDEPGSPSCDPPRTAEFVPMVRMHIVLIIQTFDMKITKNISQSLHDYNAKFLFF